MTNRAIEKGCEQTEEQLPAIALPWSAETRAFHPFPASLLFKSFLSASLFPFPAPGPTLCLCYNFTCETVMSQFGNFVQLCPPPSLNLSKLRKRLRETVSVASGALCLHNGRCNCTQVLSLAAREQKVLPEQQGQNCRLLFISWNCRRQLWKCSGNLTCLICKGKWWREHFCGHPAAQPPTSLLPPPSPFQGKMESCFRPE